MSRYGATMATSRGLPVVTYVAGPGNMWPVNSQAQILAVKAAERANTNASERWEAAIKALLAPTPTSDRLRGAIAYKATARNELIGILSKANFRDSQGETATSDFCRELARRMSANPSQVSFNINHDKARPVPESRLLQASYRELGDGAPDDDAITLTIAPGERILEIHKAGMLRGLSYEIEIKYAD